MKILDLILKCAPDKPLDKFEVKKKFMRKLNLKKHFALNKDTRTLEDTAFIQTYLKNCSILNPKTPGNQCLGAFKKMVEDDLGKLIKRNTRTKNIWNTIKQIGKKNEVIIRPVDKGGSSHT